MAPSFADIPHSPADLPIQSDNGSCAVRLCDVMDQIGQMLQAENRTSNLRQAKLQRKCLSWIEEGLKSGTLTLGVPKMEHPARALLCNRWLGERLCWWPNGVPDGRWIAMVSSRLGQRLDRRPEWFESLRAACAQIRSQQGVLLVGERTATGRFAERAAELFGMRALVVHGPRGQLNFSDWLQKLPKWNRKERSDKLFHVVVSPPVSDAQQVNDAIRKLPINDRATIAWGDEIVVLHLRRRGNLELLLRDFLEQLGPFLPEVHLALGARFLPPEVAAELQRLGAKPWEIEKPVRSTAAGAGERPELQIEIPVASPILLKQCRVVSLKSFVADLPDRHWPYLTHCTRGPAGRWPEQTETEFLTELLQGQHLIPRSPLNALQRIVEQRLIRASAAAIRGKVPAVCFTEVPLTDIHLLREYQPQRKCWDFEPYGLCIRREWMVSRGTRQVIYGDDEDWRALTESDRPYFQFRETRHGRRRRDWTQQREWRHIGDVPLSNIPADAVLLFVPDAAEATQLAAISPWPIVICGE